MTKPRAGQEFTHFKGGHYKVHFIALSADTQEEIVCYESLTHGGFWARRMSDWEEMVDRRHDYDYVGPRFQLKGN